MTELALALGYVAFLSVVPVVAMLDHWRNQRRGHTQEQRDWRVDIETLKESRLPVPPEDYLKEVR